MKYMQITKNSKCLSFKVLFVELAIILTSLLEIASLITSSSVCSGVFVTITSAIKTEIAIRLGD